MFIDWKKIDETGEKCKRTKQMLGWPDGQGFCNGQQSAIHPDKSGQSKISLKVFYVLGREMATLVDGKLNAGVCMIIMEAKNLICCEFAEATECAGE